MTFVHVTKPSSKETLLMFCSFVNIKEINKRKGGKKINERKGESDGLENAGT